MSQVRPEGFEPSTLGSEGHSFPSLLLLKNPSNTAKIIIQRMLRSLQLDALNRGIGGYSVLFGMRVVEPIRIDFYDSNRNLLSYAV